VSELPIELYFIAALSRPKPYKVVFYTSYYLYNANLSYYLATHYNSILIYCRPRSCIGQGFAKNELRALVAAWVLSFEFEMQDANEEILAFGMVTVKPRNGLYLRVKPLPEQLD
jgi:Cytochrome P450